MKFKVFVLFVIFHLCYADTSNYSETNQSTTITKINATNLDGHLQLATLDIVLPINNSTSSLSNTTQLPLYKDSVKSNNETSNENVEVNVTKRQEDTEAASTEKVNLTLMKNMAHGEEGVKEGPLAKNIKDFDFEINKNTQNIEDTSNYSRTNQSTTITNINSTNLDGHLQLATLDIVLPINNSTSNLSNTTQLLLYKDSVKSNNDTSDEDAKVNVTKRQEYTVLASTEKVNLTVMKDRANSEESVIVGPLPKNIKDFDLEVNENTQNIEVTTGEIQKKEAKEKNTSNHLNEETTIIEIFTSSTTEQALATYADTEDRPKDLVIPRFRQKFPAHHKPIDQFTRNEQHNRHLTSTESAEANNGKSEDGEITTEEVTTKKYTRYTLSSRYGKKGKSNRRGLQSSVTKNKKSDNSTDNDRNEEISSTQKYKSYSSLRHHIKLNKVETSTSTSSEMSEISTIKQTDSPENNISPTNSTMPLSTAPTINRFKTKQKDTFRSRGRGHPHVKFNGDLNITSSQSNFSSVDEHYNETITTKAPHSISKYSRHRYHTSSSQHLSEKMNGESTTEASNTNSSLSHQNNMRNSSANKILNNSNIYGKSRVKLRNNKNNSTNSGIVQVPSIQQHLQNSSDTLSQKENSTTDTVSSTTITSLREKYSRNRKPIHRDPLIHSQNNQLSNIAVTPNSTRVNDNQPKTSTNITIENENKHYRSRMRPQLGQQTLNARKRVNDQEKVNAEENRSKYRPHIKKLNYHSKDSVTTEADAPEEESTTMNSIQSKRVYERPPSESISDEVTKEKKSSIYRRVTPRVEKLKHKSEDSNTTKADAPEEESTTMNSIQSKRVYKRPSTESISDEVTKEKNLSKYRRVRPRVEKLNFKSEDFDTTKADAPEEESTTMNSIESRRVYKRPLNESISEVTKEKNWSKYRFVRPRVEKLKHKSEEFDTAKGDASEEESTTMNSIESRRIHKRLSSEYISDEVTEENNLSKYRHVRPRAERLRHNSQDFYATEGDASEDESTTMNSFENRRVYERPSSESISDEVTKEKNSSTYRRVTPRVEKLKHKSEDSDTTKAGAPEEELTTKNNIESRRVYNRPLNESPSDEVIKEKNWSTYRRVRPRVDKLRHNSEDFDRTEGDASEEESTTMNSIESRRVYNRFSSESISDEVTKDKHLSKHRRVRPRVEKLRHNSQDFDATEGDAAEEESTAVNIFKTRKISKRPSSVDFAKDFEQKGISNSGKNFRRVHMKPKKAEGITLDMLDGEESVSYSDFEKSSAVNMRKSRENGKHDGSIDVNTGEGKTPFSATGTVKVLQKGSIFDYSSIPADSLVEKAGTGHKNAEKEDGGDSTKESSVTGTSDSDLTLMQEYIDKRSADDEAAEQSTSSTSKTAEVGATNVTDNFNATKSVNQTYDVANKTSNTKDSTKENLVTVAVETATQESENILPSNSSDTLNGTETHQNSSVESTEIIEDDIIELNYTNGDNDDKVAFNWNNLPTTTESSTTLEEDTDKSNILVLTKYTDGSKDRKTNESLIVTTILGHPTNVSIRIQTENNTNYIPLDVKVSEDISHLMLNFTWPTNENITNTITLNMKKTSKQYVIDTVQMCLVKEGNVSIWTKNVTQSQVIQTTGSLHLELGNGVQVMFSNADFLQSTEKGISSEDSSKKKEGTVLYVEIIVGSVMIVCLLIIFIFAGWKMIQLRKERRDLTTIRH